MGFRACVWDLDGTLLYTLPTIHHYCNQSLRHFGFHDITLDECRDLCRLSIAEFYHKLLKLGGCPPDRVAALQPLLPPGAISRSKCCCPTIRNSSSADRNSCSRFFRRNSPCFRK